jgi:hypothetical protein
LVFWAEKQLNRAASLDHDAVCPAKPTTKVLGLYECPSRACLRNVRPDLRVLFTSGYSDQKVLKDALDISAVVRKPFDLKELKEKLAILTDGLETFDSKSKRG